MVPPAFDFAAVEALWLDAIDRVVAKMAQKTETFYAIALHGGYAEAEGPICPPALAINSAEGLQASGGQDDARGFASIRWNPADWAYVDIRVPQRESIAARYEALTKAAGSGTPKYWQRIFTRYELTMFAVMRKLGARARGREGGFARLRMTPDFIAFLHTEDHGVDGVKRSVPASTFARLFPEHGERERARHELARMPPAERAEFLLSRFGKFDGPIRSEYAQRQMVAMGSAAVPALLRGLADPELGATSAAALGDIGPPAARAVPALVEQVRARGKAVYCAAAALGQLGAFEELLALIDDASTASFAALGLTRAQPQSYPVFEALLHRGSPELTSLVTKALAPGSSSYSPAPADFDLIVATASSKHAVLRARAASALGSSSLGERHRRRAAPILVRLLADPSSEVRRLAVLALGRCGRHAQSALPELRAAMDDEDPKVASTARGEVADLASRL